MPTSQPAPEAAAPAARVMREALAAQEQRLREAAKDDSGEASNAELGRIFIEGGRPGGYGSSSGDFVADINGVEINGRAAVTLRKIERLIAKYQGVVDLRQTIGGLHDSYADVWAKLTAIEKLAESQKFTALENQNAHLEKTLTWVDAVMRNARGKQAAIHAHHVYYHDADSHASEIGEGIGRVDKYIDDALALFKKGGRAEKELGKLEEVFLVFDTRGYGEIRDHVEARYRELNRYERRRFTFAYLDEMAEVPRRKEEIVRGVNAVIGRYKGKGLMDIAEGVLYSRLRGLLLELETIDHYHSAGYKILRSGQKVFDRNHRYVTELDAVVRSPDGKVKLVEARSLRTPLFSHHYTLRRRILYKLKTYKEHRGLLERFIRHAIDEVVFAVDCGRQTKLALYLKSMERRLSRQFGFPVSFLFLQDGPEVPPTDGS